MGSGLLKTLAVGDIKGEFIVYRYQRGYRWGEHEVSQLLTDIRDSEDATYYLQPLVVKKDKNGSSWELVDGQQRLTTLYLLFQYIRRTHLPSAVANFAITYETREDSKTYLDKLDEASSKANIDFFHMYQAYQCIQDWFAKFGHRSTHEASRMYSSLFDRVYVLWYEAPEGVDSTDLFTRLNIGRIPLTDAELVRALLLSHRQPAPEFTDRALEIAAHWDGVERDLRVPEVWAFVTGNVTPEATHISLILDTLAGGPRGHERPLFHTFETLRDRIEVDPQGFWRDVVDLHSLVLGWYDDRNLFHKVGYLTAVGRTFGELVALSKGKGRSAFETALDDEIRAHLDLTAAKLVELSYSSSKTFDVLLLMNVETIRRLQDSSERYSFKAHATGGWSLEHIHAQNAEALQKEEQWRAWLTSHKAALADIPDLDEGRRASLIGRIEEVLSGSLNGQSFTALEHEITDILSSNDEYDRSDLHSISNLALLAHRDNAALSNSVFAVKRRAIIRLDKEGSYIPFCTRNVFLKYYTQSGDQQLHFWSGTDRQAYLEAVQTTVSPYLISEDVDQ